MLALQAGRRAVGVCLVLTAACAAGLACWHVGHQQASVPDHSRVAQHQAGSPRLHHAGRHHEAGLALNAPGGGHPLHHRPSPQHHPSSTRLRYYVHGAVNAAASADPARAAVALHVATAAPVAGPGTVNPVALRAKGRLVMLNASVCAGGTASLSAYLADQGLGPASPVARQGALAAYVSDACGVAPPTTAAYVVGDVTTCFSRAVFAKARPCGCTTTVVLDLNRARHFGFDTAALDAHDPPWADKLPTAFWRGAATGAIKERVQSGRFHLLTRWAASTDSRVDVGMTSLPMSTGNATRDAMLTATTKPAVPLHAMLRHRYLVSAEGYDVATNLKWALWSRSAVIMPPPTMCSWLMEDRLVPWVHYVPVAPDFSNLTAAVDWCEAAGNVGVCEAIGAAGRAYMEAHGFMDAGLNRALGRAVARAAVRERAGEFFGGGLGGGEGGEGRQQG